MPKGDLGIFMCPEHAGRVGANSVGDYLADIYERGFDDVTPREREAIGIVVNLLREVANGDR